jgi:hypothetical protein
MDARIVQAASRQKRLQAASYMWRFRRPTSAPIELRIMLGRCKETIAAYRDATSAASISFLSEEYSMASSNKGSGSGTRGGTSEQHAEAGRQSHKNDGKSGGSKGSASGGGSKGTQGGSSEQHSAAGRQSHKNDK